MAFGLKLAKTDKDEINKRVSGAAQILQLDELLDRKPKDLSGGQRQRVAIGRTMVREPQVLLFDEPLSNLDAGLRVQMRIEIARLHKRLKSTMIYVTHDQVEAMTLADKIVVLNAGRIAQVGSPMELYHAPENLFVAGFIGSPGMNFIDVTIKESDSQGAQVVLPDGTSMLIPVDASGMEVGEKATLGIRPEHMLQADDEQSGAALQGTINAVERLGDQTLVYMTVAGSGDVIVRLLGDIEIDEDKPLNVGLDAQRCHLFRSDETACRRL